MKHTSSRSSLFIVELMIAILLFAVASAICLQVFAKSQTISDATKELNHAVSKATGIAEILISSPDPEEPLNTCFPDMKFTADSAVIYYDDSWHPCAAKDAVYNAKILPQGANYDNCQIQIWPVDENKMIYELPLQYHYPKQIP